MNGNVAVVGGGISGLATAFYLCRRGIPCTLFERTPRLGGLIQTNTHLGCTLEAGPDSFIRTKAAVQQLAHDLNAGSELISSNDEERRVSVVRNGALTPLPPGMAMMVPTDLEAVASSPLLGPETLRRLETERNLPPRIRTGDFSIRELVAEHFGDELLEYVAEPLLAGVYGGDPAQLSAPSVLPRFVEYEQIFGSLIAGAQNERRNSATPGESLFLSFRSGMGQLIGLLKERVNGMTELRFAEVLKVARNPEGWSVATAEGDAAATHLVLAVSAHRAANLVSPSDSYLAHELAAIPYSSAILISFIFEASSIRHALDGFGFLVPRPERRTIAAATWINRKFPSRVPDGLVAIRAFLVDPEASAHAHTDDSALTDAARQDLNRFMAIAAAPVHSEVHRWPASMPQYVVGHGERRARVLARLSSHRNLYLVSNYLDGVGIPDCIRWGRAIATSISDSLKPS